MILLYCIATMAAKVVVAAMITLLPVVAIDLGLLLQVRRSRLIFLLMAGSVYSQSHRLMV